MATANNGAPLSALPDDVLQRILVGVPLDDHRVAAAACRAFHDVINGPRFPALRRKYGFAEYGSDLGSSKHVAGNPSAVYRREGQGASFGGGLKIGIVRFEYAKNCNTGDGNWYAMFGDRF